MKAPEAESSYATVLKFLFALQLFCNKLIEKQRGLPRSPICHTQGTHWLPVTASPSREASDCWCADIFSSADFVVHMHSCYTCPYANEMKTKTFPFNPSAYIQLPSGWLLELLQIHFCTPIFFQPTFAEFCITVRRSFHGHLFFFVNKVTCLINVMNDPGTSLSGPTPNLSGPLVGHSG